MKTEIIVAGAGAHAKVCVEILHAMGKYVAYCVGKEDSPSRCVGVPVLIGDEHLSALRAQGYAKLFIAVASNSLRNQLAKLGCGFGYQLVNAISPSAIISPSAKLGHGIAVMPNAVINAEATIEDLAIINTGATVDHDCHIGRASHIAPQCGLAGNVSVGALSFLGIGTKVIPDIRIGRNVTIGAGGVVIRDIDDGVTAVGVPARVLSE